MKNAQQQQAKHLYFQSALNKSQIAETLGVNRRTVMLWVQQGNWDRLKMSAMHLPSMIVEKCYYILNHYLDNLLSANAQISTFGPKEAAAINQLATAIKKVRNRSAVNESMEMMSFFLDDVRRKDPAMASAITPFIEQYIASRKDINLPDFLPANFNDQGLVNDSPEDIMEQWLDEQEYAKMAEEAAGAAGVVKPNEEEVLIKSFRDNLRETRVMRPVKDSSGQVPAHTAPGNSAHTPLAKLNYEGQDITVAVSPYERPVSGNPASPTVSSPNDKKPDADNGHTQSTIHGQPDKPHTPSSGNARRPRTQEEIELAGQKKLYERRKLIEDLEKQLGDYLTQPGTQNSTAA